MYGCMNPNKNLTCKHVNNSTCACRVFGDLFPSFCMSLYIILLSAVVCFHSPFAFMTKLACANTLQQLPTNRKKHNLTTILRLYRAIRPFPSVRLSQSFSV